MPRGAPPISLEALQPYYNGVYFSTVALKGRLAKLGPECREAVREVGRYQQMVVEYRAAIAKTVEMKKGRRGQ